MNLNDKLALLRAEMERAGFGMYMLTTEDAYLGESAADYWQTLRWLTDFPCSLAYALVTADCFAFFTDARYINQARSKLTTDGVEVCDVTEVGAEFYLSWIKERMSAMPEGKRKFGVDGRTISTARGALISEALADSFGASLVSNVDLMDTVWRDRPERTYRPVFDHGLKYAGRNRKEKVEAVRAEMEKVGCDHYIVGPMEGTAWLTNMRGSDLLVNPLFQSHALFTPETVKLFAKLAMIPEALKTDLTCAGYELLDIDEAPDEIREIPPAAVVYYDVYRTNNLLSSSVPQDVRVILGVDIVNDLKSVKNEVEIASMRRTNAIECVALMRFFKRLKETVGSAGYDEFQLNGVLEDIRHRSDEFLCNGDYPTLCAYMENGASPHYHPKPDIAAKVKPEGVMIIDALAQYYGGTTDITRTIKLGPCPEYDAEIRKDYTLVLQSMMALSRQKFRKGTDGAYMDSVARCVLWNHNLHYGYGTGHGIGCCNVSHEGPQFIAETSYKKEWAFCWLPLKPGMTMANEPGVYKKGKYGVRLEDNLVIVEDCTNEFGEWYRFDTMSYCPFEPELIDVEMLSDDELAWLNDYNVKTYALLSPYLDDAEEAWLKEMTLPLSKKE